MKATAAALALGVVLPMALARAFPGQDGSRAGREHAPEAQRRIRPSVAMAPVIFTAAPVYDSLAALRGQERFPDGAQLMTLRGGQMAPLVTGFAASADASVSFDGRRVLFAGKKNAGDSWQIWDLPVEGGAARLIYGGEDDAIRPLWLPDGRVVFAERGADGFGLVSVPAGGGKALRLTYLPGNFIPDDVLADGRILFESGFPLGAGATPEMYLVYPDGSGVESARCDHGNAEKGGGREHGRQMNLASAVSGAGDIVFPLGGRPARFTSARAEEALVTAPAGRFAGDVAELPDGRWVLAMLEPGRRRYELVAWKPGSTAEPAIVRDAHRDLTEPVAAAPRPKPLTFPSALHPWTAGNLMALDARISREGPLKSAPVAVRMETRGPNGSAKALGIAQVEKDGSFFIRVPGDAPLRLILLDASGTIIRQERGWFWMRGGEQRICVGCHAGPERAPDNRVPQVLLRTTTPVDLSGGTATTSRGGR